MPILSTFGAGSFAGVHPLASGGGGGGASVIGRYFYSTTDYLWSTLTNWFGNSVHTTNADAYPNNSTHVVILSNCTAVLDYVSPAWVEPDDISVAASCTLTLTSTAAVSISCPITNVGAGNTGTLVLSGNVTYTGGA